VRCIAHSIHGRGEGDKKYMQVLDARSSTGHQPRRKCHATLDVRTALIVGNT
jgi:hypothetical protein